MYSAKHHISRAIRPIAYSSFQQAVIRNVNEKNAQMQKEINNVVREGLSSNSTPASIAYDDTLISPRGDPYTQQQDSRRVPFVCHISGE